jgi:hypothetical protein
MQIAADSMDETSDVTFIEEAAPIDELLDGDPGYGQISDAMEQAIMEVSGMVPNDPSPEKAQARIADAGAIDDGEAQDYVDKVMSGESADPSAMFTKTESVDHGTGETARSTSVEW